MFNIKLQNNVEKYRANELLLDSLSKYIKLFIDKTYKTCVMFINHIHMYKMSSKVYGARNLDALLVSII